MWQGNGAPGIQARKNRSFDCSSAGFRFVIWCIGGLVMLYPLLKLIGGLGLCWGFHLLDKDVAGIESLPLYSATLLFLIVGAYLGCKFQLSPLNRCSFFIRPRILMRLPPGWPLTAVLVIIGVFGAGEWLQEGITLPTVVVREFYINLGLLGVLLGALLLGVAWRCLCGTVINNPQIDRALGTYALVSTAVLHLLRGRVSSVLSLLASIRLPFLLLSYRRKAPVNHPN